MSALSVKLTVVRQPDNIAPELLYNGLSAASEVICELQIDRYITGATGHAITAISTRRRKVSLSRSIPADRSSSRI